MVFLKPRSGTVFSVVGFAKGSNRDAITFLEMVEGDFLRVFIVLELCYHAVIFEQRLK
jgi:hypothetical protein